MCISDWINLASAVGTIGATMVALWLALRTTSRHIDATFVWEVASSYHPTLLVQNTSSRIVVLASIEVRYCNTQVCMVDMAKEFEFAKYSILEAGQTMKIPMATVKFAFPELNNQKRKHRLKIIIRQRTGIKRVSSIKYSFNELRERFFGQELFAEN